MCETQYAAEQHEKVKKRKHNSVWLLNRKMTKGGKLKKCPVYVMIPVPLGFEVWAACIHPGLAFTVYSPSAPTQQLQNSLHVPFNAPATACFSLWTELLLHMKSKSILTRNHHVRPVGWSTTSGGVSYFISAHTALCGKQFWSSLLNK